MDSKNQNQLEYVDATLAKDRENVRELFKYIEDVLQGWAQGSADRLIEKATNGQMSNEDVELIKSWGKRWHTVFYRKRAVLESVVGEQAVEARIKLLPAAPEPELEAMDTDAAANGMVTDDVATNGD